MQHRKKRPSHRLLGVLAICVLAGLLRLAIIERQGLWVDEAFSLAMATGHSLEHPAVGAQPALGDFVETAVPVPAAAYQRYLEHAVPAAGAEQVGRAVLLSDTNPPLYYLALNAWTRWAGTSDAALRLFSVACSLLCLPLIAWLARRLGGHRAVLPACVLFALAPQSVYYATEGRMYAMVWLMVLGVACLSLELRRRGGTAGVLILWVVVSAAGLLTHYFFSFVWGALGLWLLVHAGRVPRRRLALAVVLTLLAVLPWYLLVPDTFSAWRVSQGWQHHVPWQFNAWTAPMLLAWSYFSVGIGYFGATLDKVAMVVVVLAAAAALGYAGHRAFGPRWLLFWAWLSASCAGLLVFDLWQSTYTQAYPRYALAGMPAAFLLLGAGLARLPSLARTATLALLVALWLPALWGVYANPSRDGSPVREVARALAGHAHGSAVVIVHSIPSGVVLVARYLDRGTPMAAWVGQLQGRRVPEDAAALVAGRQHIFLVKFHDMGQAAPEEDYLRQHASLVQESRRQGVEIIEFMLRHESVLQR